jgi:tetratricopeptide (TPR) repeat protein
LAIKTYTFSRPVAYSIAAAILLTVFAVIYFFARWGLANMASLRTDQPEVAVNAVSLSPSDPQTHFAAAVLLEKTFLPADFERSLKEYEEAATLSPSNYLVWLEYGKALDRHGEKERAEAALRKALGLAPNYASTKWALGNFLLRQGDSNEAFKNLREALDSNPSLADATVQSAYSWFDGDIDQVKASLGASPFAQVSLIKLLIREKRLDDALAIWSSVPLDGDRSALKDAETQLLASLVTEKRYRDAYRIYSSERSGNDLDAFGNVTNGGFEEPVKIQGSPLFEWQIDDSPKSQVAIIEGQGHSGTRSLRLLFNLTEAKDFRGVSQYVAVKPGQRYKFESFYRSDLKTAVPLKWEILSAADGKEISSSQPINNTADWVALGSIFVVPQGNDAVVIRLSRDNCLSAICPLNGSVFLDDISIRTE